MFNYFTAEGEPRIVKFASHVLLALVVILVAFSSFGVVNAGERGVKVRLGVVKGIVDQGLYFKVPFIEHVEKMDVQTQNFTATPESPLTAASNDLQDTKLAVVVNYHIDPRQAADIYIQYKDADRYYLQVVDPLIVATIKSVASQYTASDQIQKRAAMTASVQAALNEEFAGKNVSIERADITDIKFSSSFTDAIEAKVTAVQNAEAAKNKLAQVQYEAQQAIEEAKGKAEALRVEGAALASNPATIQLRAIEKWNGVLPTTTGAGAIPFINVK